MQISEAESVVMDVLWRRHPLGADEVAAALASQQDWQEATIKTQRLLNKGAISAQKEGRRYLYSPLLKREDWVLKEVAACWIACSMAELRRWWRIFRSIKN